MTDEENVQRFRMLIERGFSDGDISMVDELMAEDCVEHQRGLKPGRDGAKETIRTLHTWFSEFHLGIETMAVDGDMIWARNVARGVNTGSVMGHPPTGKPMSIEVFDIVRFKDGRIVEHWGVADQLGMMLQLGLVRRPEPAATRQ